MSTFTDYAKSKLFYIPTLENIHRGIYFGILVLVLFLVSKNHSDLELLNFWAIISIFVQLPFTIYLMIWVRKEFKPKIDFNTIFKYVFSSILVFGGIGYLVNQNMEYSTSIFEFVWIFSPYLIGSGILYVGITYLIDNKTRKLVKSIINELIKRK